MTGTDDKLIRMANQIATFFESQPGDGAEAVAGHLRDFWDPSMRARIRALHGDPGLRPLARAGIERLPETREGAAYPLTDGRIATPSAAGTDRT
ncbi:formate dehydrogenase subunit delta [Wenxinia saemankumensis]|uniref:Formate dehydrogenase subunit delta n=1 Tax=Wenxinia saemankumensis TaxID=1447782 RepID=A0A1M6GXX4_9RHOB|nr:formate dehydrogenase subunit delta [Wenxinia saemankumensis]